MLQSFGFVMVTQLKHWIKPWEPTSPTACSVPFFSTESCHWDSLMVPVIFESPCNPRSTGTTWDVVFPNVTPNVTPTTMEDDMGEIGFVRPCTSSFQHPSGRVCVCVCVNEGPGPLSPWLCFKEMEAGCKHIEAMDFNDWGAFVCWWGVDLAASALNNRLQADECYSTCSLGIEYCEILASSTEMFSSAANLGHRTCSAISCSVKWEASPSLELPNLLPWRSNFAKLQLYIDWSFLSWA